MLRIGIAPGLHLSAAVWTALRSGPIADARLNCLRFVLAKVVIRRPLWHLWMIVGHKALQPDNRVTRYHGIWKSLKKQGIDLPPADYLEDILVSEQGVRFFVLLFPVSSDCK